MRALVYHGKHDIRYEEFKDPELRKPTDLLVKAGVCGICGTDLGIYHGRGASRHTGFCVGHEAVGEVVEVGRAVNKFKPGDRVLLHCSIGCGDCIQCFTGRPALCVNNAWKCYGLGPSLQGCQAEGIVVPMGDFNVIHVPEGISTEQALLLTDNLPVAYTGCKDADIKPGSTVAVIGLGPIGMMAVELSMALGAGQVYAIDVVESRRAIAEKLGAIVLDPSQAADIIREQTKGEMVDSVVEAVGGAATVTLALELAKRRGTVSCIGFSTQPTLDFPMAASFVKGLTFRTGIAMDAWNDELIKFLQHGRIHPEKFITHRMKLSEGAEAYRYYADKIDGALKILMTP